MGRQNLFVNPRSKENLPMRRQDLIGSLICKSDPRIQEIPLPQIGTASDSLFAKWNLLEKFYAISKNMNYARGEFLNIKCLITAQLTIPCRVLAHTNTVGNYERICIIKYKKNKLFKILRTSQFSIKHANSKMLKCVIFIGLYLKKI